MILIVAFWAAMPALACFSPHAQRACCRGMMQDCQPSPAMQGRGCCTVQPSPTTLMPASTSAADRLAVPPPVLTAVALLPVLESAGYLSANFEGSPPPETSAAFPILRI